MGVDAHVPGAPWELAPLLDEVLGHPGPSPDPSGLPQATTKHITAS